MLTSLCSAVTGSERNKQHNTYAPVNKNFTL